MANTHTPELATGPTYLIHSYEHRAYPLSPDRPFTIGRDAGCDIMVNEVFVSRHHAELRPEGGASYVLHPTGSTPTMFNELPLMAPQPLREGDTFAVGTMKFVFTQRRLPVAMAIAEPGARVLSGVDDRRPTLTFPLPGISQEPAAKSTTVWIVLAAVLVVVAGAIYLLSQR